MLVDTLGKECLEEDKLLYEYRGHVKIPPLAMVDDIVAVAECGFKTVDMNTYLNTKTNLKKLQFGAKKCVKMHIGCRKTYCPQLYIDQWKLKHVKDTQFNVRNFDDVMDAPHAMETTDEQRYLGVIISSNGSNKQHIALPILNGFRAATSNLKVIWSNSITGLMIIK